MKENSRILYFDMMRVFCAIWVIGMWHMPEYMSQGLAEKFSNSFSCQITYAVLAMFSFVSGFFGVNNQISTIQYYKKRIIRLYFLYAVSCIILVLCKYNSWISLPRYLIGMGWLKRPYPTTVWFVSMVLFFNFITPLLFKYSIKRKVLFAISLEIVFLAMTRLLHSDVRLVYYWPFYFGGMLFKQYNMHVRFFEKTVRWNQIIILAMAYVVFMINATKKVTILTHICGWIFIYCSALVFNKLSKKTMNNKWIKFLSYSSFCAYLFHRGYFYLMKIVFGEFKLAVATFIYLPSVFVIGWIIQRIYDELIAKIGNNK